MVSTAFVAGTAARPFGENELDIGQKFRNTYERSKFEAEQPVQRAATQLPVCVVRPSIVVGHSERGRTTAFDMLYAPLRLFLRHAGSATLPWRADTFVDTVPVDWVAAMVVAALASGRNGETYAAASGTGALSAHDVAAIVAGVFGIGAPSLLPAGASDTVLHQSVHAWGARLSARECAALAVYAPYMVSAARFDSSHGDRLMLRQGHRRELPRVVLTRCLEYARATNFGRLRAGARGYRHAHRITAEAPSAVA